MAGTVLTVCALTLLALALGYPTNQGTAKLKFLNPTSKKLILFENNEDASSKLLQILLPLQQHPQHSGGSGTGEQQTHVIRPRGLAPESTFDHESTQQEHRRPSRATNTSESQPLDMLAEASDMEGPIADSQHFYPSFSPLFPPLGHSRPPFYPEPVFNARPAYKPHDNFGFGSGNFREYTFPQATADNERSANVLGSGNFGVIRGGTYYPGDNDELLNEDLYNNYYNNGHGRPTYYPANPLPAFRNGGDFFANFKDFAEISTPTKSSYSQFYVVYVNPNSTNHNEPDLRPNGSAPKNIFEQLQILDATDEPPKKLSKTKLKLEKYTSHHQSKEVNKKHKVLSSPKELYEPLLALS